MADSNSFSSPYEILPIAPENKYLRKISPFFFVMKLYGVYSNEYTQHTIIVWKIEKTSLNYRQLPPDVAPSLTLSDLNYTYLEQVSMVPKIFEPLKFDCINMPPLPQLLEVQWALTTILTRTAFIMLSLALTSYQYYYYSKICHSGLLY